MIESYTNISDLLKESAKYYRTNKIELDINILLDFINEYKDVDLGTTLATIFYIGYGQGIKAERS